MASIGYLIRRSGGRGRLPLLTSWPSSSINLRPSCSWTQTRSLRTAIPSSKNSIARRRHDRFPSQQVESKSTLSSSESLSKTNLPSTRVRGSNFKKKRQLSSAVKRTVSKSSNNTTGAASTRNQGTLAGTIVEGVGTQGNLAFRANQWKENLYEILLKPRTVPIPRWITPRHYTYTLSECCGHGSFVLVAMSYAVDDFLTLRIIAVAGSTAMLFFTYFHPHGRVLWLPFKWNALFIAINSYRIGKIFANRHFAENISEELLRVRKKNFYLMDPVDYARLVRMGTVREYKTGDLIIQQHENNRYVRFVISGKLKVLRDGKLSYTLEEANFLSEAGIHAGLLIPGKVESCCTVVAEGKVRILEWDRTELVHLMECHGGVRRSLKAVLSWDIVRKLKAQRKLLASGVIDDPEEWTERRQQQTQHRYEIILEAILKHPEFLQANRKEFDKYRFIHHIDEEHHNKALAACGWTPEEFERGYQNRKGISRRKTKALQDEDDEANPYVYRDLKWYLQDIYLRAFG